MNETNPPQSAVLSELEDAHGMIRASKVAIQQVRQRKLTKADAKLVFHQLGLGVNQAHVFAELPECAAAKEAFEHVASEMTALRDEARELF